jgi:hypothetical protein
MVTASVSKVVVVVEVLLKDSKLLHVTNNKKDQRFVHILCTF